MTVTGMPADEEAEIQSETAKVSKDGYLELSGVMNTSESPYNSMEIVYVV